MTELALRQRRQRTIHVEGLPPLTLKVTTKCGVLETHPDLLKHFSELPQQWEGCDSLLIVSGVPDWEAMGTLTYTHSPKHEIGFLEHIFLMPDFRGKGIAREMNRFAMEDMKEKGIRRVYTSITAKEWVPRMKAAGFWLVPGTERLYVKELESSSNPGNPEVAGSNPAGPLVPYWVLPAAFTTVLVLVSFAGWVASQLEKP